MYKKSIVLLKKNPILIIIYAIYMILTFIVMFTLYPWDMSRFNYLEADPFILIDLAIAFIKMILSILLLSVSGLLFFCGYGNMIVEALFTERTSVTSFLPGIKRFFVKVLLASLLMTAFAIGFSILLTIIMLPIMLLTLSSPYIGSIVFTLLTMVLTAIALPFVILWYPSLFIDQAGVIQGMKNGAKAGVKNYWKLLLFMLPMYLPAPIFMLIDYESISSGNILTPGYIIMLIITSIISLLILPIIFILYKEYRDKFPLSYHPH